MSGSLSVQNKTHLGFPTAREGIGHVRLGRKRRGRGGSRKRRRSRGRRMVSVCPDALVLAPSVLVHNDRPSVSDHSGAHLGSGADPGPARVPGRQRGRSSGGECSDPACLPATSASVDRLLSQAPPTVFSPVLQSAGELENDEHTAAVMMQMVRTATRFRLPGSADPPFKRMSGKTHTHVPPAHRRVPHLLVTRVHSHPGRLRLCGDGFCPEGLCCQTPEQPAPANRSLAAADRK